MDNFGIARDYGGSLQLPEAVRDALGMPLNGTGKALVVTSGTAIVEPDPAGSETNEDSPVSETFVLRDRIRSERHALRLSEEGVRVSALRLPPYVYGRGGSYFVPLLMQKAAELGQSIYVDDGTLRTSAVHVDDAAELYLLAASKAKPGEVFNCTGSTNTSLRQLAEAIGAALELPVRSVSREEAEAKWGQFLTAFVQFENRASSAKAGRKLGWRPQATHNLLADITVGSYAELAQQLRSQPREGSELRGSATAEVSA
jgi:nucleoside-diphosphate-sugar epimerase